MGRKAIQTFAMLSVVAAVLLARPSAAAQVIVSALGTVGEVAFTSGPDGTLFPFTNMDVGDPFLVSLRFDDAVDLDPDPDVARFESLHLLTIQSPNGGFPGPGSGSVVIRNDQPGDSILITGSVTMPPGIVGSVTYELVLVGSDMPLSGPSLESGTNLHGIEGWDPAQATFRFDATSDSYGDGHFVGTLNVVPEPGTAALVLLGLTGCAAVRAGQRRGGLRNRPA